MDDGALKERAEKFIRENAILTMTDDEGEPLPDAVGEVVRLLREVLSDAEARRQADMPSVKEVAEMVLGLELEEERRLKARDDYARAHAGEGHVTLHTGLALAAQSAKVEHLKQFIAREGAAAEEPAKL